jgi:hypothetical protein
LAAQWTSVRSRARRSGNITAPQNRSVSTIIQISARLASPHASRIAG